MKTFKIATLILMMGTLFACSQSNTKTYAIIPQPVEMKITDGEFKIDNKTQIVCNEQCENVAKFFAGAIKPATNIELQSTTQKPESNYILLEIANDEKIGAEGYRLSVTPKFIEIKAQTPRGLFFGVQTVLQLMPTEIFENSKADISPNVACAEITDYPRFKHRGLHLDVCRHFFTVDEVKQYIDLLAMHKMNTFHWHLTDDQGWRIEIKKYPRLTEVGSNRKGTLIGAYYDSYPQQFDYTPYGGFYTQEQIKEVVAYAAERYINVIPEIELPGHAVAAINAYPELSCTGKQIDVEMRWGVFDDVFCPTEETFAFLEDVFVEVIELFPSEIIHIGGDECPKVRWKECPKCQALIRKLGYKDDTEPNALDGKKHTKEEKLQSYFVCRMEKFLNEKGRKIIGWDEILQGGIAPNATVMSWRGVAGGEFAARQNHDVIMAPMAFCYLDFYQYNQEKEPVTIGNFTPISKTYSFEPVPADFTPEQEKHIIGIQGNLWNEYTKTYDMVEYKAYPRAVAIAEIDWIPKGERNYADFVVRLRHHFKRLDARGVNYCKGIYDVRFAAKKDSANNLIVEIVSDINNDLIRYTTDGSTPTEKSNKYTGPIKIEGKQTIKAANIENGKMLGEIFEKEYFAHKAMNAACTIDGNDAKKLTDGLLGNKFENPGWYTKPRDFERTDGGNMTAIINLGAKTDITKVSASLGNQPLYRVVAPIEIIVSASDNGSDWTEISRSAIENPKPENRNTFTVSVPTSVATEYLKIELVNAGSPFPKGSTHEGKPSAIICDEIFVE